MDKPFIERLIKIISRQRHVGEDEIEAGYDAKSGFNMNSVVHECGTPSCIAGYAKALVLADEVDSNRVSLQKILGKYAYNIDGDPVLERIFGRESESLFFPSVDTDKYIVRANGEEQSIEYHKITPKDAVQVLRHFVKTEEIDWLKADGFKKFLGSEVESIVEKSSGRIVFFREVNQ